MKWVKSGMALLMIALLIALLFGAAGCMFWWGPHGEGGGGVGYHENEGGGERHGDEGGGERHR